MLERVQIENFRCFKKVDVRLKPLTVLIGPNDSGKSAFLGALRALSWGEADKATKKVGLPHGPRITGWDIWRREKASVTRSRVFASTESGSIEASSADNVRLHGTSSNPVEPTELYLLPSTGVSMDSANVPDVKGPPNLGARGQQTAAFLDHLSRQDRTRLAETEKALRALIPGFEGLSLQAPTGDKRRIDLVIESGLKIPASKASVGVRLIIFFVALAYHPDPPKLILLEEPENGVHPRRLEEIIRLLREITEGKHAGHAAQVVLTTHSPHLLDYIDVEKDRVLVFRRNDEDGSRAAEPVDAERLKVFLDEFMLGEVWYNEGEEGLIKRDK